MNEETIDESIQNHIKLIRSSYTLACDLVTEAELATRFFDYFFTTYPETKSFFDGSDLDYFNRKKLNIIFEFMVDVFEHPHYAQGNMIEEVMRHQIYGLKDEEYYFMIADSLIQVVKDVLGSSRWTQDINEAWNDAGEAFKYNIHTAVKDYIQ